jgi:hypothetical protein
VILKYGSEGYTSLGAYDGDKLILELGAYSVRPDETGKLPPIDENEKINGITVLDSRYKTAEGVHVGITIADAEKKFGKLKEMRSFPHDGEVGEFADQPKYFYFTFGIESDSYSAGIYEEIPDCKENYPPLCSVATKYNPGAYIASISIPNQENQD